MTVNLQSTPSSTNKVKDMHDLIYAYEKNKGKSLTEKLEAKNPLFICVIGVTETAKIPGISAAGKQPELTDYTPPADVELLLNGMCKCIHGVPVTPEGVPTPALITFSALKLASIETVAASGGLRIKPQVPFLDFGGKAGRDIRTGDAVDNVEEVMQKARVAGEHLAKKTDYMVVGESIPGGTTTALSVLLAMGVDARGKVSSSMPCNPHKLKVDTAEAGLKAASISFGSLADDPMKAVSCVGDPMLPAFAGLVLGAARTVPVLIAGGTQMGAALAIINALNADTLGNLAITTTRWVVEDSTSDLKGIVAQIADIPILAADLDFSQSRFEGLKAYEKGMVKEGVGAGGACIAAILKSQSKITSKAILEETEANYKQLIGVE
jgi:uncharacterized protein (TIGR00303 family)